MLIPVCHVSRYGSVVGSVVYDTVRDRFIDSVNICNRQLPVQDYMSCEIINSNSICTVVGKGNWGITLYVLVMHLFIGYQEIYY